MLINRKYQIWQSASGDMGRESLEHVNILDSAGASTAGLNMPEGYNGLMLATDGFQLAIVPVELDEDDIPGLLSPGIIKDAGKASPKAATQDNVFVDLRVDGVARLFNNATFPRVTQAGLNYPDVSCIVPAKRSGSIGEREKPHLDFDVRILVTLVKSIGLTLRKHDDSHATITFNGDLMAPYIVERASRGTKSNDLVAPFGLIMPVYYGR